MVSSAIQACVLKLVKARIDRYTFATFIRYSQSVMSTKADMKMNIQPLGDRVLVRPIAETELGSKTKSGIFIPETIQKERSEHGVVVAVGPGKIGEDGKHLPMSVKVGQTVLFTKYGPDEIKVDGKEYFILSESNILAIIG